MVSGPGPCVRRPGSFDETSFRRCPGCACCAKKNDALKDAVDALRSLPVDCLGVGVDGELKWPIRDELIDNLCKAIQCPCEQMEAGE